MHFLSANNVEYPSFVKLTNGLKVTTNSLSPFVIAWKDARVITPPVVTPDYPVYYPTWYPMYNYTPRYTIKFNSLGGTDVNPIVFENSVKLDIAKLVPTKNGYVFGGWYLDAGLKNRVLSSDIINNDTILYARWLPLAVSQDITTIQQEVEVPQTGDSWIKNILKSLIA
ncbi:MAG: InlB B-repeat-containing protein [Oscillospiraceae bacterium]